MREREERAGARGPLRSRVPLLVLAVGLALGAHGAGRGSRDDGAEHLAARLLALDGTEGAAELRELSAELAAADPAFLLAAAAGRLDAEGVEPRGLGPAARELAGRALEDLPLAALRRAVDAWAEDPPEAVRLEALERLGRRGTAADVGTLLDLADPGEEAGFVPMAWRVACERALGAVHRRHPEAVADLRAAYPNVPPGLLSAVVRALGADPSGPALAALADLLEREGPGDLLLLNQIARAAEARAYAASGEVRRACRAYLSARDARLREEAARVAGALLDDEAVDELIQLLESRERGVARRAAEALERIAGRDLGDDAGDWEAWLEEELRWWRARSAGVFTELRRGEPAACAAALREVAGVRLYRRELASEVAGCLGRPEEGLAALACAVLAQLDQPDSVSDLAWALEDLRAPVRAAAHAALVRMRGRDLGWDPERWLEAAGP